MPCYLPLRRILTGVFDNPHDPGYNDFKEQTLIVPHRPQPGGVLVIGHRGGEALAPENTWAAFRAGYRAGADLLELDVQLACDGEAILFHDFTLQPKLGDARWVRDLTWADLCDLDVGSWYSPAFAGERIPRLADLLEWARGRVGLWVDLKHGFVDPDDGRLEMRALDLIQQANMADQVVISSWDQVALARIKARLPEIPLAVNLRERVADPAGQIAPTGARWVVVYWPQIDHQDVARLHEAGLLVNLVNVFTGDYREALRLGVDAVTVTDPGAARAALGAMPVGTDTETYQGTST
jgi:glycerophosphoryl diester phosphodiesterase